MFLLLGFSSLFRNSTACGQLSEAAARLAEIMHYDPKIDYFCNKHPPPPPPPRNNPIFSMYPLLCAGVCTCAYPCVWQWVYTWLQACAHWTATCLNVLKGSDECCKSNRVLYLKKERRRTTHIWDDSVRFSPTPSQLTRALLISGWACSCVGRNHMGEIKLSPIWGYVLNSVCKLGCRGREEGGWDKAGCGDVHRCWIENSFPIIILTFTDWEAKAASDRFYDSIV